jgi:DNA replication protein DnaC
MTIDRQSFLVTCEEVESLKLSTIGKVCNNKCGGRGALLINSNFLNCDCVDEFERQLRLLQSNIPKKYWDFNLENLTKEYSDNNNIPLTIIKSYISKIKEMAEKGVGLYIQGSYGLAKSALSFYILKEAIKEKIVCYSINMSQLTNLFYDFKDSKNTDRIEWIKEYVQLLVVEEIEKDYNIEKSNTYAGSLVNDFFRVIYDNKKSLILTSNLPKKKLREDKIHADNVIDRFEELVDIILVGNSFRKQDENLKQIIG